MTVLVLGRSGQVGFELMRADWPAGLVPTGLARPAFDLARPDTLDAVIGAADWDVVINAAAYTSVDQAEGDSALAHAVNRDGPARLAGLCAARGVPLLHLSTDYVFDGAKPAPYTEDDPVRPLSVYGASKAAGEAAVRAAAPRHVILRTSWVYGVHGRNFVRTMLRLGRERDTVTVVDDQRGAPTAAAAVAAALVAIASRIAGRADAPWGTYHFSAAGETTWHDLAERVFRHLERATGRRPRLVPVSSAGYAAAARRPANSRLDCARVRAAFGVSGTPWPEDLATVLAALLPLPGRGTGPDTGGAP